MLFDLSFITKMAAENTNDSLVLQLPACLLEGSQQFMIYLLTITVVSITLYYPLYSIYCLLLISSIYCTICKKLYDLPHDIKNKRWIKPRKTLTLLSDVIGKILHGYEVCGIENLPEGPAILLCYHGAAPIDLYLFTIRIYRLTGRTCYGVVHRLLFKMPVLDPFKEKGLWWYLHLQYYIHPTREECVELLKKGNLVSIAPGGIQEQNYGDHTYNLVWGKRKGFAQVAIDAKVPIVPVFTQNIREGYRTYGRLRIMRWIYERTRFFPYPVWGPIPVKLRTHVGQPIPYDPNITADELAEKAKKAIEALRDKHQKIPGSILRALWERFEVHHKHE